MLKIKPSGFIVLRYNMWVNKCLIQARQTLKPCRSSGYR